MNYEDELDRSRARKSRRRESERETAAKHHSHETENLYSMSADPGSRAGRAAAKSHGAGSHNHKRRKNGNKKKKIIIGVLIALIVLVLGFSGAVYAYIQHNFGKMNGQNEFDLKDVLNENISLEMRDKMEKGYWTIAVFGLDSRDGSTGKAAMPEAVVKSGAANRSLLSLMIMPKALSLALHSFFWSFAIGQHPGQPGGQFAVGIVDQRLDLDRAGPVVGPGRNFKHFSLHDIRMPGETERKLRADRPGRGNRHIHHRQQLAVVDDLEKRLPGADRLMLPAEHLLDLAVERHVQEAVSQQQLGLQIVGVGDLLPGVGGSALRLPPLQFDLALKVFVEKFLLRHIGFIRELRLNLRILRRGFGALAVDPVAGVVQQNQHFARLEPFSDPEFIFLDRAVDFGGDFRLPERKQY